MAFQHCKVENCSCVNGPHILQAASQHTDKENTVQGNSKAAQESHPNVTFVMHNLGVCIHG